MRKKQKSAMKDQKVASLTRENENMKKALSQFQQKYNILIGKTSSVVNEFNQNVQSSAQKTHQKALAVAQSLMIPIGQGKHYSQNSANPNVFSFVEQNASMGSFNYQNDGESVVIVQEP